MFIILGTISINAQVVVTTPEFPIANQPVTIVFDVSQCPTTNTIYGYTGDVYAHTGVILEGGTQWTHVIGNWGDNPTQPKLTKIGATTYQLDVTTSINSFYNVVPSETVKNIAVVFRSADGSKQSSDIFLPVYQGNNITITSPDSTKIFTLNDIIPINAVALSATSISLKINDVEVSSVTTNSISYNYTAVQVGKNIVSITATTPSGTLTKNTSFFVRSNSIIQDLPSSNLVDGINYIDANTVTLVLYAPGKDFVFVKGSFDNWGLSASNQMYKTTDGKKFWLTFSNLTPGTEYTYQYIINGITYIADPYCDKILDPWNDSYITSSTYPGLIPYPIGKATGYVSVFQTNQTPFVWTATNYVRPDSKKLIIYETHIRDFIAKHDYKTMIDTIQYFKNLGISAVELMPINEFEGNNSWGYNPALYFAPDKYYGPKENLKSFIDECHKNGIAVIIDMVLNHSFGQSPLVQMYWDAANSRPATDNPWYNVTSPNTAYSWGYDFNHESQDTKNFVDRVNKYWLEEYKVDGFRFDFTKGFTNRPGDGGGFDQSRINILTRMATQIQAVSPGAYVILEHFADNAEEKILANSGMLIWGNISYSYAQAAMGQTSDRDFSWISYKQRGWDKAGVVGYMESHDEERMMYRNTNYGIIDGTYSVKELNTGLQRAGLAAAFFIMVPGPKMLWEFQELGYDFSINQCPDGTISNNCRVDPKPIHWEYYQNENRKKLHDTYKDLIALKNKYDIFSSEDFTITQLQI